MVATIVAEWPPTDTTLSTRHSLLRRELRFMYREQRRLAGAPALLIGQGPPYRGTVLMYHGLGSNKEAMEKELYSLADRKFLAVGIDAVGHGERRYPDYDERMKSADSHSEFLSMVRQSADEVSDILEALRSSSEGLGKFGLIGISMGGCIAFAAAVNRPGLGAVAPILATPDWSMGGRRPVSKKWLQDSPHLTPEWFNPLPLLIQNAGKDEHVSPEPAREFAEEARRYYHQTPHHLVYKEYPESGHFMRPKDWHEMWDQTMDWFERFL
jgi:pimeloyl-ACP methyl ester carboxylesterase